MQGCRKQVEKCSALIYIFLCYAMQNLQMSAVQTIKYQMQYRQLTIQLYYQNYNTRIKDQIDARKRHKQRFSQQQIWYLVFSIVRGVRMFQKIGMSSGNLKTDKILLNQKGHLKIINTLSYPQDSLSQQSLSENNKIKRFFAPEQLRAMRQRIDKTINPNIAETFAIGIIILQLTTFIDGNQFYDAHRLTLNDYQLKQADQILAQNYSKLLYNLTRTMLSGQYDRPLPSQIYSVFVPYESQILNLNPFDFRPLNQMPNHMGISNASLMSL